MLSATSPIQQLTTNANAANCRTANTLPKIMDDHSAVAINPISIIGSEFIDIITLLPKAMFSSSIQLDNANSFTVHLPLHRGDLPSCKT